MGKYNPKHFQATEWRLIVAHGANRGYVMAEMSKRRMGRKPLPGYKTFSTAPAGAWKTFERLNPQLTLWATTVRCSAASSPVGRASSRAVVASIYDRRTDVGRRTPAVTDRRYNPKNSLSSVMPKIYSHKAELLEGWNIKTRTLHIHRNICSKDERNGNSGK